jgi:hypothetical protein
MPYELRDKAVVPRFNQPVSLVQVFDHSFKRDCVRTYFLMRIIRTNLQMKRLFAFIFVGTVGLTASVRAETNSFTPMLGCRFKSQDVNINDRSCKVSQTYNSDRQWTATRIEWSDGVVTQIEIQTVNRREGDRGGSRYGLALVDGTNAEYQTFSDGGICFTIETNRNTICYR